MNERGNLFYSDCAPGSACHFYRLTCHERQPEVHLSGSRPRRDHPPNLGTAHHDRQLTQIESEFKKRAPLPRSHAQVVHTGCTSVRRVCIAGASLVHRLYTRRDKGESARHRTYALVPREGGRAFHKMRASAACLRAQLRWLDATLSESTARWKIVLGHHPIYSAAPAHGDTKELIADVLPVLQKHGVRIYFCGHDHVLQHLAHGDLNFFVCGGGASHRVVRERDVVRFSAASTGFLSMTLSATGAEARYFDQKGEELYLARISAP